MHKDMRRKDRLLTDGEARKILEKCDYGTLATVTADNEPYAVPLSYVLVGDLIYFHCALKGEKVDNIEYNNSVCFSVVGSREPTSQSGYSVYYESCTVFGKARLVTDPKEFRDSLMALAAKYFPNNLDMFEGEFARQLKATAVYAVSIDKMTGKSKRKPVSD